MNRRTLLLAAAGLLVAALLALGVTLAALPWTRPNLPVVPTVSAAAGVMYLGMAGVQSALYGDRREDT